MMQKLQQNQWEKDGKEFWLLSLAKKIELPLFYFFILLLPTQLGKHFWPNFAFVLGSRVDYLSPTLYTTDILLVLLFLLVIFQRNIKVHPFFSLTVLFLSVGVFFSSSAFVGWYLVGKFLEVSFLVWYVAGTKISRTYLGVLLSGGLLLESLLAFLQVVHQGSVGGLFYLLGERNFSGTTPGIANASIQGQLVLRPYATFSHPNMLAGYSIVAVLLVLFALLGIKKKIFILFAAATLISSTIALALSLSRVGIFLWVLIGVVVAALTFRKSVARAGLLLALIGASALLFAFVLFPSIIFRFLTFPVGQSLSERIMLARFSLALFSQHPLMGVGLNNFIPMLPSVSRTVILLQPVHNVYLLIATETGAIGFFIFLTFFVWLAKSLFIVWQKKKSVGQQEALLLGLALFAIFFSGFFDHYFWTLQQGQLLFGLVVGLIFRQIRASATIRG